MNGHCRVASVSMHSVMGDVDVNLKHVGDWMRRAHQEKASFTLLTEECITGSLNKSDIPMAEAMTISEYASGKAVPFLEALCRELDMTAVVGTIEPSGERFLNSTLIIGPEGYITTFSKLHLPNETERKWFDLGTELPIVTSQGWTFGVGICFDVRFPEIFRSAAQHGAEMFFLAVGGSGKLVEGDASRQARAHIDNSMTLLPARAVDNGMYVFFANQAGRSGNASFPGHCLAVNPDGVLIGEHSSGGEGMIVTDVYKQIISEARESPSCTFGTVRPDVYANPVFFKDHVR